MIHLIAAVARNGVIGYNGTMPWHLPADLQHFKALTMGHTIIMGRRTYESIGGPLPGRQNIVISTTLPELAGCSVAASLEEGLALADGAEIFILGGAMLYQQALPMADQLDLTLIDAAPQGDTWFPAVDRSLFVETERDCYAGTPAYCHVTWRRKA